ncbi:thiamine phosphate synthase [Hydrogenimonas sp.]
MIRYAITDPSWYGSDPHTLKGRVGRLLARGGADWVCLRDKSGDDYEALARAFLSLPNPNGAKRLLHTDWKLAQRLGAWGVHLPTKGIAETKAAKEAGLFVVVSTHSLDEALQAQKLGADAVTFSPVFATPGKGAPQGLEKLKEIKDRISITLIALGGIVSPGQIEAVEKAGADGFASIRYFRTHLQG